MTQAVGSVLILVFAVTLGTIARYSRSSTRIREALTAASLYLTVVVLVRMLALWSLVSQTDARVLNGLLAAPFLAAVVVPWLVEWMLRERAR